jgi:hypothetical protein
MAKTLLFCIRMQIILEIRGLSRQSFIFLPYIKEL